MYIGRELTPAQFRAWFRAQGLGGLPFNAVGIHYTYKPTERDWRGTETLDAVFRWYHEQRGWPRGVGPHVWLYDGTGPYRHGEPLVYVGTHPAHDGIGIAGRNHRWLHVEAVGDFDARRMSPQMEALYREVLRTVCGGRIPIRDCAPGVDGPAEPLGLLFHRDAPGAGKSCPGWTTDAVWFYPSMAQRDDEGGEDTGGGDGVATGELFKHGKDAARVPRLSARAARLSAGGNVRKSPSTGSPVVTIGPEEDVRVVGWQRGQAVGGDDRWYLVRLGYATPEVVDRIGYVHSSLLLSE